MDQESDITLDPTVLIIYWCMVGTDPYKHCWLDSGNIGGRHFSECVKCCTKATPGKEKGQCVVPDPIPLDEYELAFYMRDYCVTYNGVGRDILQLSTLYLEALRDLVGGADWCVICKATPRQMIQAACVAWQQQ